MNLHAMTTVNIFLTSRQQPGYQTTPAQVRQIKALLKRYWPGIRVRTFNRLPTQAEMYNGNMIELNVIPVYDYDFRPELLGAITGFNTPDAPAATREQFNCFTFTIPTHNAKPIFQGETAASIRRHLHR